MRGGRRRERRRGQAAIGLHQLQRRLDPQRAQTRIQGGDIGPHDRLHIGIYNGGGGAGILLDLRQDLAADGNRHIRQRRPHRIGDGTLMRGIGVAVQQADRQAAHLLPADHIDRGGDAVHVQRHRDRAIRAHLFGDFQPQPAFHQRAGLGPGDVIQNGHPQVADFQNIAEPARGDQRRAGALGLQDGVRADGGGMQNIGDLPRFLRQQC